MSTFRLYAPLTLYILVFVVGLIRWSRLDRCQRLIIWYELLCISTTLGLELLRTQPAQSLILVHIHAPVRTLLFAEMFASATTSSRLRITLRGLALAYLAFWVGWWAVFGIGSLSTFSAPVFHINTAVNLLLALAGLAEMSREFRVPLTSQAAFWLATGLMLDAALSLIFFPAREWLLAHRRELLLLFTAFHASWVMVTHGLFGKALLCPPRTRSS